MRVNTKAIRHEYLNTPSRRPHLATYYFSPLLDEIDDLTRQLASANETIGKLPRYEDTGKAFVPCVDEAWVRRGNSIGQLLDVLDSRMLDWPMKCYSTKATAREAVLSWRKTGRAKP